MELKSNPVLNIKAMDDETGEFEGYGSTFGGEPDSYGDVIVKGAFTESLKAHRAKGSMPKMFWQHDPHQPIGKWLDAREDESGLLMRGKLSLGVPKGAEAYQHLKDGNIDGLSIGFRLIDYEKDKETGTWFLKEIDLKEVSIVSIGANESALISSVKAAKDTHDLIERLKAGDRLTEREFEAVLKGALGFSNSQAERAARVCLKGQGEPDAAATDARAFLEAIRA